MGSVALGIRGSEETSETGLSDGFEGVLNLVKAMAIFFLSEDAFEGFSSR